MVERPLDRRRLCFILKRCSSYLIAVLLGLSVVLSTFFFWGGGDSLAQPRLAQTATAPASSPTPKPSATVAATPNAANATPAAAPLPDNRSTQSVDELESYDGIPVGFTVAGDPFMGDPAAPVTIFEFSDYLCPFCGRHFSATLPTLIDEYVLTGRVQYVFLDYPIASLHPMAALGHVAARCVGEEGAVRYWEMHHELFSRQAEWSGLSDPRPFLNNVAASLAVDMTAFSACLEAGRQEEPVTARIDLGSGLGVTGTPTFDFLRNGDGARYTLVGANPYATYAAWLDALLAGEEPPIVEEPKPELPYWANAEGLAPDPDRPGFTMAGDPFKGSPDALLTIVEFSDFQCPACAKQVQDVQPVIDRLYLKTGKVRWVFKNYPLREHAQALVAASAAECAGEQQVFWEFHDALFADPERWAVDDVDGELIGIADEVGLDIKEFASCLAGRKALERVVADMYDAQGTIDSTPTFIGLHNGLGALYRGGRDLEATKSMLDGLLDLLVASSELLDD